MWSFIKTFFVSLNIGNTVRWATVAARLLYITAELEPFGLKGINFIDFLHVSDIIYELKKKLSQERDKYRRFCAFWASYIGI